MRVKRNILYVLILIFLLSLFLIFAFGENKYIFSICTNILAGNIVAIVITVIEFYNERLEILDDFVEESYCLHKQVCKQLNMSEFTEIYITVKEANEEEKPKTISTIVEEPKNVEIIETIMKNVVTFTENYNIRFLGKTFFRYKGLFEFKKRNALGKELYEVYLGFKNIRSLTSSKAFHFNEYFNSSNGNKKVMVRFLIELFDALYRTSEVKHSFIIYGDWAYKMELSIGKIMKRLNDEHEDLSYDSFLRQTKSKAN